ERHEPQRASRPSPLKDWIVFEDEHVLVINKPPGVQAQAQGGKPDEDALSLARDYVRSAKRGRTNVALIHRIDRNASGILVFAKTEDAARRLTQQFRSNGVKKEHIVLVRGQLDSER